MSDEAFGAGRRRRELPNVIAHLPPCLPLAKCKP